MHRSMPSTVDRGSAWTPRASRFVGCGLIAMGEDPTKNGQCFNALIAYAAVASRQHRAARIRSAAKGAGCRRTPSTGMQC